MVIVHIESMTENKEAALQSQSDALQHAENQYAKGAECAGVLKKIKVQQENLTKLDIGIQARISSEKTTDGKTKYSNQTLREAEFNHSINNHSLRKEFLKEMSAHQDRKQNLELLIQLEKQRYSIAKEKAILHRSVILSLGGEI